MDFEDILDKKVKYDITRMKVKGKDMIDELGGLGIEFNPTDKEYADVEEVDAEEESAIDQYEDGGIKIIRSIYYDQDLENQFVNQDALHQIVGGVSGTIIERKVIKCAIPMCRPTTVFMIIVPKMLWQRRIDRRCCYINDTRRNSDDLPRFN